MTAVPPRPAAPDTSCGCDADLVLPHPAHLPWPTPDAPTEPAPDLERAPDDASRVAPDATAGDGLRSAILGAIRAARNLSATSLQMTDRILALPALRDVLAAAEKLNQMLREAGIEYPLGLRGVSDLIDQRDGQRQRAEEAEAAAARDAEKVRRVEELVAFYDRHEYSSLEVDDLRRALDPS